MANDPTQTIETYARGGSVGPNAVTTTAYRAALAGGDSANLTSPIAAGASLKKIGGRTTVYVTGSFSIASATAAIVVVFYAQAAGATGAVVAHANATLTAEATITRDGTRFDAVAAIPFDALAENYEVRVIAAPSAGTVSLFTWCE